MRPSRRVAAATRTLAWLAPLLLVLIVAVGQSQPASAATVACGTNGQCVPQAACASFNTFGPTDNCQSGEVCCQAPSCQSGSDFGLCQSTGTCASGRIARGLCPGPNDITCCLPPASTVTCYQGTYGACVAPSSCTGTAQAGLCPDASTTCCLAAAAATCQAQGQTGSCSKSCSSGNTVAGICADASSTCCLPNPSATPNQESCVAQGQTGVCQAYGAACASGNTVTGVCSNNNRCCLPNAPPATSCRVQGMVGNCQKVSTCTAGNTFAGLCPGDSTIQCCLPSPPSYGTCTTQEGFVGDCRAGTCAGVTSTDDLCPGPDSVKCCVTNFSPSTQAPAQNYGTCAVNGKQGTCQSTTTCSTTPVPGYCPGPNSIQCCPSGASLPAPIYAPAAPAAGTFFGACAPSVGTAGTCMDATVCTNGGHTPVSGVCPGGNTIQCCPNGGPAYVGGVDLPGGRGVVVTTQLTSARATCLASASAKYILLRGWTSTCQIDSGVVESLKEAAAAGLAADVYLAPAAWCGLTAKAQALQLLSAILAQPFGRIFVGVEVDSGFSATTPSANLDWVVDATDALSSAIGSARVGIFSSAASWSTVMGAETTNAKLNAYPLIYTGATTTESFVDLGNGFGGWTYAYAKRTVQAVALCDGTVDQLWMPVRSATPAAAGSAPASEPAGPACSLNGVTGTCQSDPSVCSPTASSVRGVCDGTKVCCLSAAPQQPAVVPPAPLAISYGNCVVNATTTGICQPSAFCAATDAQYIGVAGCAADPNSGDVDVTCCVPVGGVQPPPSDDSVENPPPYVPSLFAVPSHATGSGKDAIAHVPSYRVSRAATTSAASTTATNPAQRVCVNKAGLELIESYEGFSATFYLDAVGIKTIGFGTACHAYPCETLKTPLTRAQAEAVMLADMTTNYASCVRNWIKVPLNSNQFSALTSFVYNAGCGAIQQSVGIQLNAGCYSCVKANLAKWNKAGGKVLDGLTKRRAAEAALFNNPVISPCLDGTGSSTGAESHDGQSWGSCSSGGRTGDCIAVSNCDGDTVAGLCSGPSNIKCCLAAPPNPPTPAATACGTGGKCMATTSCNTGANVVRTGLCAGPATITCCQPKSKSVADGWWDGATRDPLGDGSNFVTTESGIQVGWKIVLHTTEGGSYEGARGAYAGTHPHFTVTFQRGMFQAYQHVPITKAAKALKHPAGTANTNNACAIQIEVVGQSVNAPNFPQKYLDGLATLMRWIEGAKGIPKRAAAFLAYPASAGQSKVRMTDAQWLAFSGTCGHQHVPSNDHGDPGTININYLLGTSGTVWSPSNPSAAAADTPGTNGVPGDFGKCTSEGRSGVCQDRASCGGSVVAGLCGGPSNIACCLENYGSCTVAATSTSSSLNGICQESSTCNGKKVSGLCAGSSSVICCVPDYGSCASGTQTGTCQTTSTCTGTIVSGLCAGPASVACCLPTKPASNFGSCSVAYTGGSVTGQCLSKSQCAAPNVMTPGLCPGSSDISCCHNPAPVRTYGACGTNGNCQEISSCTGTVKRGLCPGASSIACCENPPRAAAAAAAPLNYPRSLFTAQVVTPSGAVTFGAAAPAWTLNQLTLCTAGGVDGFCMDGSVGDAICNGVASYPSSCASPAACCTPRVCTLTNTTAGVCIPPTECLNQAGYVTPGYCGVNGGADGSTSCCTGVGASQCDSQSLLACLLGDGDASTCAASFNCPPLPDYASLTSAGVAQNRYVQSAPSAGPTAHNISDRAADPPAPPASGQAINGATSRLGGGPTMAVAVIGAIAAALFAIAHQ